jgi:hypothetical protein
MIGLATRSGWLQGANQITHGNRHRHKPTPTKIDNHDAVSNPVKRALLRSGPGRKCSRGLSRARVERRPQLVLPLMWKPLIRLLKSCQPLTMRGEKRRGDVERWGVYDLAVLLIVVPLALPRSVEDDERDDVS